VSIIRFPSYALKLSNLLNQIYLLAFITHKCLYIRQMRAMLKICLQHLDINVSTASLNYYINIRSFIFRTFQNVRWCFSSCLPPFMLAWLASYDALASQRRVHSRHFLESKDNLETLKVLYGQVIQRV
jgi:hypothetical protein